MKKILYLNVLLLSTIILSPIFAFSTENSNSPYTIITQDSVYIISKPFCKYGTYGKTTVQKGFHGKIIYQLDQYIYPNTFFSIDGNYHIGLGDKSVSLYYRDSLIKLYSIADIVKGSSVFFQMSSRNDFNSAYTWVNDAFIYQNEFYAFLVNTQLLKIKMDKDKISKAQSEEISAEDYEVLKAKADPEMLTMYEYLVAPEKDQVKCSNNLLIDDIIKKAVESSTSEKFNLCISIAFRENKAKVIGFFTSNSCFEPVPIHKNDIKFDHSYDTIVFKKLIDTIEKKTTYTCSFDDNIEEWAFNYIVPINKHGKN
jgi:hypothetical protein